MSTVGASTRLPSVAATLVVADFDTELVVLVPERRLAHHLDPLLSLLFDSCRRGDGRGAFESEIASAAEAPVSDIGRWTDLALDRFRSAGITTTGTP